MSKALKRDITQFEIMKQKQIEKLKILKKKVKKQIYSTIGQTEEHTQADEEAKAEGDEQQAKPEEDFVLDEIAWKKVKGEVFKRPKCSLLFSIMIGTGVQIFAMTFFFMIFALIGVVSPQYRGAVISSLYIFFIMLSNVSGFYSARFYKMFQGTDWLLCAILTSFAFPSLIFTVFLIINFANWFEDSSAAIAFPTILVLLLVYCALSIPNVWFGAFFGFKKTAIKNPGKVNKLSREIPTQPWYLRMKFLVPLGGIFPFM